MNKKLLIIVAAAIVVIGGGIGAYLLIQKQQADKLAANTVTFANEDYVKAVTMVVPKDKGVTFEQNQSSPKYATFTVTGPDKTYTIEGKITYATTSIYSSDIEYAKKEENFTEIQANEKTKALEGYAYTYTTSYAVRLKLGEDKNRVYLLDMTINSKDSSTSAVDTYKKPEVRELLTSIRVVSDYKAPEKDYVSDGRDIVRIKKLTAPDGFTLNHSTPENNLNMNITSKENEGLIASMSIRAVSIKKTLEEVMAADSNVVNGSTVYSQTITHGDIAMKQTTPKKIGGKLMIIFYYFTKDGVVCTGSITYPEELKTASTALTADIVNNLSINKDQAEAELK